MIPLMFFDLPCIHDILDDPDTIDWIVHTIQLFVTETNIKTLTKIELEGGEGCDELLSYKDRIQTRSVEIKDLIKEWLVEYAMHYDHECTMARFIADDFLCTIRDVVHIINKLVVPREFVEMDFDIHSIHCI